MEPGCDQIAAVRRFNRFYTRRIGVLEEGLHRSPFSLTEVRVLYEIGHRAAPEAAPIGRDLGLDRGYLSRILRGFEKQGLLARVPSPSDGRRATLRLTETGMETLATLEAGSSAQIAALLRPLPEAARERLAGALDTTEALLGGATGPVCLRQHAPGDIGWIVARHGTLYAAEYGWDAQFEALVAEIGAAFLKQFDPQRERCWIAERHGVRLGSVLLVRQDDETAKLRLLLVEPEARGLGLGRRLVESCTEFAHASGYRRIVLWTNSVLEAARAIYARAGYRLMASEPHRSFGHDLIGETWQLDLR